MERRLVCTWSRPDGTKYRGEHLFLSMRGAPVSEHADGSRWRLTMLSVGLR